MANAKRLPSGNWRVRVTANGVSKSFTAPSKKEAELMAAEFAAGRTKPSSEMTLEEAIDSYIEQRSNILSPSTIQGYKVIKNNNLLYLAKRRLCDISHKDLQKWVNDISGKYAPKTVYNVVGLVSSIFREYSPSTDIDLKMPPKTEGNEAIDETR